VKDVVGLGVGEEDPNLVASRQQPEVQVAECYVVTDAQDSHD
jgi:hypothetical protein